MSKSTLKRERREEKATRPVPTQVTPADSAPQNRAPVLVAVAVLVLVTLAALGAYLWGLFAAGGGSSLSQISYVTQGGDNTGVADSPLQVTVRLPWREGDPQSAIASVTLLLLDEAGQPARFGPTKPEGLALRPSVEMGAWVFDGSLPSAPGNYQARLILKRLSRGAPLETVELREPVLVVTQESGEPLRRGYVLSRNNDLWLIASDVSRERRLTYFDGEGAVASDPIWSPDGKRIALTLSPMRPASELPRTEIWQIAPDGSGLQKLVEPGPEETLLHPAWGQEGKSLYFSVDRLSNESLPPGSPPSAMDQYRRIDRIDLATGAREQVYRGAQWPVTGGPTGVKLVHSVRLVYIEDAPPESVGGVPRERLVLVRDGGEKVVLLEPGAFPKLHAPSLSPDGKWVAFATYSETLPDKGGYNLLDWLLFKPRTARAHDAPWDVFLVPTRPGAQATALTELGEDEPFSMWLGAQTLVILGERGLYRLGISERGEPQGEPLRIREGVKHGEITWYGP